MREREVLYVTEGAECYVVENRKTGRPLDVRAERGSELISLTVACGVRWREGTNPFYLHASEPGVVLGYLRETHWIRIGG